MIHYKNLILIFLLLFLNSCSNIELKKSSISEKDLDLQVLEAYEEGMKSLKDGDVLFAAKKFNEVEVLFPQSKWAPKSSLMAAYSYYSQDYYEDAILELQRYLKTYPFHVNQDYAYYILALSYYEQIADEKKDLSSISNAKKYFDYLINNFPETEYTSDAKFKNELIKDILASKEIYLGRYYLERKKWIPAINRFRAVIDLYDTTIYTEEALYRLVEVYYMLGLKDESLKYAKLLGYNYKSSKWYERSYSFFDKKYKINKKVKEKKSIIKKFKSFLIN